MPRRAAGDDEAGDGEGEADGELADPPAARRLESFPSVAVITVPQLPFGATGGRLPNLSPDSPGFGKPTSSEWAFEQPLPMLARNISGSASNAALARVLERKDDDDAVPARTAAASAGGESVMVTGAQFMYLLPSPTMFNHVQANVASPVGKSAGTVKVKALGQPPMTEWMTLKTLSLVGSLSYVILTWHEPPPCTAVPLKLSHRVEPRGRMFVVPLAEYTPGRCLHG
jgi:hypothetical protein